ncbi:MAG: DUF885 domain-containing protein [Eubacterium sp.]|nr:DUF885 domain-containing protein [Eubacterium sp.]
MKHKFWKKSRVSRLVAYALVLGMMLSLAACGKEAKDTRQKAKSIFEFFDDEPDTDDPWATESTQAPVQPSTGDVVVDPPEINPPASDPNQYSDTENEELNQLFAEYFEEYVTSSSVSYRDHIQDGKNFGGLEPPKEATLGEESDYSEEGFAKSKQEVEDWIARLEALDVNTFTEQQRFDYDYLLDNLKTCLVTFDNIYIGGSFAPMQGVQANFPVMFTDWFFLSKEDIQLCIDIMKLYPPEIDKALEFEKVRTEKGYGYEDCIIDKIIEQCDEFLNQTGENFMITVFNEHVDGFDGLTDAEREDFKKQFADGVNNQIVPMYQRIRETFVGLKGKNQIKGGMVNYEHGSEIYAYLVREYSGSTKTPEEMIQYLEQKMSDAKTRMSMYYIRYPDAYQYFTDHESSLFNYLSNKDPKEMEDYLINNVMSEFPDIGEINYDIMYFEKSLEKIRENSVAYYMIPPIDDTSENTIRVNGAHLDDLWVTLAHEGCPGHMYQTNYYRKTNPNPIRCMGLELGYLEGWAVYASYESLKYCDFNGSQYADVLGKLAQLDESYGYMIYGRIDLGINAEGWTLEDVRSYVTKMGLSSSSAETFYTLLSGDPGVYLSYSVGYLEMQDMRDYAEEQLGDKFNVVEYHKAVLDAGPCKYDQLKKRVDKYILENK